MIRVEKVQVPSSQREVSTMRQSAKESLVLWSVLAVVLGVTYGIGSSAGVRSEDSAAQVVAPTTRDYVYQGPSHNYATTPNPESLIYSESGSLHDASGRPVESGGDVGLTH